MGRDPVSRRQFVRSTALASALGSVGSVAGCLEDDEDDDVPGAAVTIAVGPGGSHRFEPAEAAILSGETVVWQFEVGGHNVSGNPDHGGKVSIPDGAEPFASYEGDNEHQTESPGEQFAHTFETTGEYQYVCLPHASQGMVGTVVVE